MALNIQTLLTRSLSSLVFVFVLLTCVLLSYLSFSLLFLVVAMLALKEFYQISEKMGAHPFRMPGYFCGALLYFMFLDGFLIQPEGWIEMLTSFRWVVLIIPVLVFSVAVFNKKPGAFTNAIYTLAGIIYCVLPFALLLQLCSQKNESNTPEYSYLMVLGVIFLIWSNDTFAYLGGSLFGKHKMIERISPGKTWEGTLFGIIISFAISFWFKTWLPIHNNWLWPVLGLCVPVMATLGDLVESLLKRQAGIKDSGNLMPGHGGALDRFDSLIFVSPFVFVIVQVLNS